MQEKVISKLEELMQANLSGGQQQRSLGSSLQQRPSSKGRVEIDEGATAVKDARIKLLEEQMVENAREASKENAALKLPHLRARNASGCERGAAVTRDDSTGTPHGALRTQPRARLARRVGARGSVGLDLGLAAAAAPSIVLFQERARA